MTRSYDINIGFRFGKPDIERIGIFVDFPPLNFSGNVPRVIEYTQLHKNAFVVPGSKIKSGTQDGYFDKEFKTLEAKETKLRGSKQRPKQKQDKLVPFIPPGSLKKSACPGDYYGCFSVYKTLSNKTRKQPERKKIPRNIYGAPAPKGNAGYPNICMSPYPKHSYEPPSRKKKPISLVLPIRVGHFTQPYFDDNPFREEDVKPTYRLPKPPKLSAKQLVAFKRAWRPTGPGKKPGNKHDGCFTDLPPYESNLPLRRRKQGKLTPPGTTRPHSWSTKTLYTPSVMQQNVSFKTNERTFVTKRPEHVARYI